MGTDLFVISPLLPAIANDFAVSASRAGLAVTVFSLVYMAAAPVLGQIADRVGRLRILAGCLLAFAAANVLTAAAGSFGALLAARLIAGLAAAGVSPSVYALVGEAAPAGRRATWLGVAVSGLLLSLSVGTPVGAVAGAALGWRAVFAALALLSLVLAVLNRRLWTGTAAPAAARSEAGPGAPLGTAILARRLAPTVVWATALYGMYTYLGAGLEAHGFSPTHIAGAVMAYGGGAIVGTLLGGRLADRRGVRFAADVSVVALGAGLVALYAVLATGGGAAELVLALLSAAAQIFFPAQQAGLANDFPPHRATVLAWNNSALFLGISLGALLGGQAVAQGGFSADVLACGGVAFLGWLANALAMPRRRARPSAIHD